MAVREGVECSRGDVGTRGIALSVALDMVRHIYKEGEMHGVAVACSFW